MKSANNDFSAANQGGGAGARGGGHGQPWPCKNKS